MLGYYVTSAVLSFAMFIGIMYSLIGHIGEYAAIAEAASPAYMIMDGIISILFLISAIRFTVKAVRIHRQNREQAHTT